MKQKLSAIVFVGIGVLATLLAQNFFSEPTELKERQSQSIPENVVKDQIASSNVKVAPAVETKATSTTNSDRPDELKSNPSDTDLINYANEKNYQIEHQQKSQKREKSISASERFANEDIDYDWKSVTEEKLYNILNDKVVGEDTWVDSVECKSSLCKLDLSYTMGKTRLVAKTLRILSESEDNPKSFDISNLGSEDGYLKTTLFFHRDQ